MNDPRNGSRFAAALELPQPRAEVDNRVRVLVADADGLARGMMRFALRSSDRIAMVHAAANAREALELGRYFRPDVAIVDAVLPPGGGLELVRALLIAIPSIRVLTVSSVNDERTAIAALRAGAVGHIGKDVDPEELAELVVRVADGEAIVPQWVMPALLEALREVPRPRVEAAPQQADDP
jgi:DNA-binding NarL/FixJ family response regulator